MSENTSFKRSNSMIQLMNWVLSRMRSIALRVLWRIRNHINLAPASDQEAYYRLRLLSSLMPRYQPGTIFLPFGRLHFIDVLSLRYQFLEIFIQRSYDFDTERPDPLIFDCGANIGLSVIWFKLRYPQSRIVAFEADPVIAEVLEDNLNRLGFKEDVKAVRVAVWTKTGKIRFLSNKADSGRVDERKGDKLVDAVRLTDWITEPVDLLKLDIEGAEYEVIHDLCETGKIKLIHRMVCEIHGRLREDQTRLAEILATLTIHNFHFTFNHARCAPDLPGEVIPTPFSAARDGRFLLHLYAWQGT